MIATLVACIYVMAANGFLRQAGAARGFEPPSLETTVALWVAGILTCLIVHEAGHRIAGASLGWRCVRFGFGPVEFFREGESWRSRRVKTLWGAFVQQMPPSFAHYRLEKATTLLGGPVSSLIFGLMFAAIALTSANPVVFELFGKLGLCALVGVLELIPRLTGGIGSDGYRLWQVVRGGQAIDEMLRETMGIASNFTALRHRDWPHAPIVRLAAGDDPYNIYLAYLHTLDAGNVEAASEYMRRLIAKLPEKPVSHFAIEAAYWLATYGGNAELARKWIERAGPDVERTSRLRAEAAVALAEGQPDRAESLANEALAQFRTPAACGSEEYDLDRLNYVLQGVGACGAAFADMATAKR
jgi:hypothetical protein